MYNFSMKVIKKRKGEEPINIVDAALKNVEDETLKECLEEDIRKEFKALICYKCQEEKSAMYQALMEIVTDKEVIFKSNYALSDDCRTSLLDIMREVRVCCKKYLKENPKSGFISGTLGEF